MTSDILFVYYTPHPSHEGFAKAVSADFRYYNKLFQYSFLPKSMTSMMNGMLLPKYPIYLSEGGAPLSVLAINKIIHKKSIHVNLIADETFILLSEKSQKKTDTKLKINNFAHKFSSQFIDGAIAVSNYAKETAEKCIDVPIKIVNPFIENDLYERLFHIHPRIQDHIILTIGYNRPSKGMDLLINSFQRIKSEVNDAELFVIGGGYPKEWESIDGVHIEGFVNDLVPYFMKASLYVQPSMADTFPVSTLESLRAGLPTIVTEHTGTKEVIQNLGDAYIRKIDSEDITKGIMHYFDLQPGMKEHLSEKAKEISKPFSQQNMCHLFQAEFNQLIDEIS
ncbi:MAG TPA: glycosyltransferase [Methanoregulaceae archaeon]|nr:glycosyltransferase [Methanoregulaceae archaeon]